MEKWRSFSASCCAKDDIMGMLGAGDQSPIGGVANFDRGSGSSLSQK